MDCLLDSREENDLLKPIREGTGGIVSDEKIFEEASYK